MNRNYINSEMILMKVGKVPNGLEITEDMILNSLNTFINAPIVLNKNGERKDYTNQDEVKKFNIDHTVGVITDVRFETGKVLGLVTWYKEEYKCDEYNNWQIDIADDKKSFTYCCAEVF